VSEHKQNHPSAASQLFDLRTVIAVLFGVYGIVLTVMGLFTGEAGSRRPEVSTSTCGRASA
jgi:hypothetical protein